MFFYISNDSINAIYIVLVFNSYNIHIPDIKRFPHKAISQVISWSPLEALC